MSKQKNTKKDRQVTEADIDATISEIAADFKAAPNPEAVRLLREEYGVTFDILGDLVQIKNPKALRKQIRKELEENQEAGEPRVREVAASFTRGASKTGEVIAHAVLDVPVEGAKTASQAVKGAARHAKENFKANKARRMDNAAKRRAERKANKAARAQARAEEEARQAREDASQEAAAKAQAEARVDRLTNQ